MRATRGWLFGVLFLALGGLSGCDDESVAAGPGVDAGALPDSGQPGCVYSGSCEVGSDPCLVGRLGCAADGSRVCEPVPAANGTACGADRVCLDGQCADCKTGERCTEAQNPCRIGALACDSGAPACGNLENAPDGTSCGTGRICQSGQCAACVPGAVCMDAANPCLQGVQECSSGVACVDLANASDGTSCGANLACLLGVCTCEPGGICETDNPCQTGRAACVNGAPVCENVRDVPDGTNCGASMACLSGACVCQPGGSCTLESNPCKVGRISCDSGAPVCAASTDVPDGTSCGTDLVCRDGACVPCAAGGACLFGTCKLGTLSCDTGAQLCADSYNAQDGTVCDTNGAAADEVCNRGNCVPCSAGESCTPSVCTVGVTDCRAGFEQCVNVQAAPDGTSCGNSQYCLSGQCRTCVQGASCHPDGDVCKLGTLACTSGVPSCVFTSNAQEGLPCGVSQTCQSGVCTCNDTCASAGATSCANPSTLQTCTADPGTGCLTLQARACGANQLCQGGACVCNDTCSTEGATQCIGTNGIQTCTRDSLGCLSWQPVPVASCPAGVNCSAGACACPAPGANDLYVDGSATALGTPRGSDLYGNGSQTCPFATITRGLAAAASRAGSQVVHVAAATYANGESFQLLLPANVALRGGASLQEAGNYRIRGDGATVGGVRATLLANGGSVQGFQLRPASNDQSGTVGVLCNAGSPAVGALDLQRYGEALLFNGTCSAVVSNSNLLENGNGGGRAAIVVEGEASAQIRGCNVRQNAHDGIRVASTSNTATWLSGNGNLAGTANDGLSSNDEHGVRCVSGKLKMQANKVWDNGWAGVAVEAACYADLSGADNSGAGNACALRNDFGCNYQRTGSHANVESQAIVPVGADHNTWEDDPPRSGAGNDYLAPEGGIDVSAPCGTSNC